MASSPDFTTLVPGFDFLQGLMKNAGAGVPDMAQWIAPTIDPDELGKRIEQLRTVQFWLEQNARLLATTVQALEVQRMTLSTLKTMNLPLASLRDAMTIQPPGAGAAAADNAGSAAVDPMLWWNALTQQFTALATQAVQDGAAAMAPPGGVARAAEAAPQAAPVKRKR